MANGRYVDPALEKLKRIADHGIFDVVNAKDAAVLLLYVNTLEHALRDIHQTLKRGEATKDHGPEGNAACIIDHLTDFPEVL